MIDEREAWQIIRDSLGRNYGLWITNDTGNGGLVSRPYDKPRQAVVIDIQADGNGRLRITVQPSNNPEKQSVHRCEATAHAIRIEAVALIVATYFPAISGQSAEILDVGTELTIEGYRIQMLPRLSCLQYKAKSWEELLRTVRADYSQAHFTPWLETSAESGVEPYYILPTGTGGILSSAFYESAADVLREDITFRDFSPWKVPKRWKGVATWEFKVID